MTITKILIAWICGILVATIALVSCGGGTSAGLGSGSGIGGTGSLTTVQGNVVAVTASLDRDLPGRIFASVANHFISTASAQLGVPGIQVSGGNQSTTTDQSGNFLLIDVVPSDNFTLIFTLNDGQQVSLPIGVVPQGTLVRVSNIVINSGQGSASSSEIEVKENPSNNENSNSEDNISSEDNTSVDNDSVDNTDNDNTDNDSNDNGNDNS